MQCEYCGKQAYVTHICPHCKEYYCLEHRDPRVHHCSLVGQLNESIPKPAGRPRLPKTERLQKPTVDVAPFEGALRRLFAVSFALIVVEESLRLLNYAKNPPFLVYLDGNIYVEILYQYISPYIASVIVFLSVCLLLFGTRKFSRNDQGADSRRPSVLRRAVPFAVFTAISITYLFSIVNWLFILTS